MAKRRLVVVECRVTELPAMFAPFQRIVAGDETLLELAKSEFEKSGLGAEFCPATEDEILSTWRYAPLSETGHMVHLPRQLDVSTPAHREEVMRFARALRGRARGLVVHDQRGWVTHRAGLARAVAELNRSLLELPGSPTVFLEYAAGLELDVFAAIMRELVPLSRVCPCIDTGHVVVFGARRWLEQRHPGLDAFALGPECSELMALGPELPQAALHARRTLVDLVELVASSCQALHFHLHDAHLMSRHSVHGPRDHVSFGKRITLPQVSPSGTDFPTMLGVEGLAEVLSAALARVPVSQLTLTLEIHLARELPRRPLGPYAPLFASWKDITGAEITYQWLAELHREHQLIRSVCEHLLETRDRASSDVP